jgi:hypothetical protein
VSEPELSEIDRIELLHELGELIGVRGYERFVSWPIVCPTREFLPDEWTPSLHSVAILVRRLMLYANIDLPAEVTAFDRHLSEEHPNAPAWFAGIENGICKFGIDIHELNDPQSLIAALSHEVAHAYRNLHFIVEDDREIDEKLTDLTAIYLGLGIFVVNATERYRKSGYVSGILAVTTWSMSSGGYLDAPSLSFLFAAHVAARGENAHSYLRFLEPNQASYVRRYFDALNSNRGELLEQISIPPDGWPEAPHPSQFVSPLEPNSLDVSIIEHGSIHESSPPPNMGRPVFRVRESRTIILSYLGLAGGAVVGLIATAIYNHGGVIIVGAIAGLVLALVKGGRVQDRCSGPGCRNLLGTSDQACSKCGGVIRGRIRDFRDHLTAEEEFLQHQLESAG